MIFFFAILCTCRAIHSLCDLFNFLFASKAPIFSTNRKCPKPKVSWGYVLVPIERKDRLVLLRGVWRTLLDLHTKLATRRNKTVTYYRGGEKGLAQFQAAQSSALDWLEIWKVFKEFGMVGALKCAKGVEFCTREVRPSGRTQERNRENMMNQASDTGGWKLDRSLKASTSSMRVRHFLVLIPDFSFRSCSSPVWSFSRKKKKCLPAHPFNEILNLLNEFVVSVNGEEWRYFPKNIPCLVSIVGPFRVLFGGSTASFVWWDSGA